MTPAQDDTRRLYADGLESIIELLGRVRELADAQRTASQARDLPRFMALADERDALTSTIRMLDARLAPMRAALGFSARDAAAAAPALVERHRTARAAVDAILALDEDTHAALRDADTARRVAAQALEAGEQTLAAYRRVISVNRTSALFDARS